MIDLGLRRHTVRIVDHRPEWTAAFQREAAEIWNCVGDLVLDVQHVGSTAVAGLPAKPILDVAIAVHTPDAIPPVVERLGSRGYIDRGYAEGGYLLVRESEPDVRTIHLHILPAADNQWLDYITFRETLRQNPDIRRRYAELKQTLADRHRNDLKAYTAGKAAFIRAVLGSGRSSDQQGVVPGR